jgi:hypothetical protein
MHSNKKPFDFDDYDCIGGVNGIDVWARRTRSGEQWDIILVYPSGGYFQFDIYLTRDPQVRKHQQREAMVLLTLTTQREELKGDAVYRILLLIKLFAPRMFRGNTNPDIVRYMKDKEKEMSNADT